MQATRTSTRRNPALPIAICIALYLVLGVFSNLPAWLHGPGSWMACGGCGDNGQEIWFLRWGAYALVHLQDPLRTNWLDAPWGADLANSTSMPLIGTLSAPITLLFGPVASYNLLNVLAYASTATAALFACRRWVSSWPAAFLGGLLYGFSPYMVGQGEGHLFALMAFVPPLLLLVLHDIFIRRAWSTRRCGLLLALLVVVQLGISAEILAEEAVVGLIGALVLWAARPALIRSGWPRIWRSLAIGIGLALPFVLAVVVIGATGAEHVRGPVHPISLLAGVSSDLLSPVVPTGSQHFSLGEATYGTKLVALTPGGGAAPGPDLAENGAYIGIPLLIFLVLGTWRLRREGIIRFAWLMAAISLLLSMGSRLHVGGTDTVVRLPFWVLTHLPLLKSEAAARYSLLVWLFLAILAAIAADRWLFDRAISSEGGGHGLRSGVGRAAGAALLVLSLLSLVPQWPYPIDADNVPAWLASSDVKQIPTGSTLVTYPYASTYHNLPMFWQAVNGMRYRIPVGEVILPEPHVLPFEQAFDDCWNQPNLRTTPRSLIPASREVLTHFNAARVVVPFQYSVNPSCAVRFLTATLQRPPRFEHRAAVWVLPRAG